MEPEYQIVSALFAPPGGGGAQAARNTSAVDRVEVAMFYRELLKDEAFEPTSAAAQQVNDEIHRFAQRRLDELFGGTPADAPVPAQFTDEEVGLIRLLIEAVRASGQRPAQAEAVPTPKTPKRRRSRAPEALAPEPPVEVRAEMVLPPAAPPPPPAQRLPPPQPSPPPTVTPPPQRPAPKVDQATVIPADGEPFVEQGVRVLARHIRLEPQDLDIYTDQEREVMYSLEHGQQTRIRGTRFFNKEGTLYKLIGRWFQGQVRSPNALPMPSGTAMYAATASVSDLGWRRGINATPNGGFASEWTDVVK